MMSMCFIDGKICIFYSISPYMVLHCLTVVVVKYVDIYMDVSINMNGCVSMVYRVGVSVYWLGILTVFRHNTKCILSSTLLYYHSRKKFLVNEGCNNC